MSEGKHAPGPWSIEGHVSTGSFYISEYNHGAEVAIFHCEWFLGDEISAQANAHLIAAAPDMLEALELARDTFKAYDRFKVDVDAILVIESAISKAKGVNPDE